MQLQYTGISILLLRPSLVSYKPVCFGLGLGIRTPTWRNTKQTCSSFTGETNQILLVAKAMLLKQIAMPEAEPICGAGAPQLCSCW